MSSVKNIKQLTPDIIWKRGEDYFESAYVQNLKANGNIWSAKVHGTSNYKVKIEVSDGNMISWKCNCPYDFGPVCKHVVAVALAISEKDKISTGSKASGEKDKWEQILNDTPKEQIIEFLIDFAKKNEDFKHQVKVYLGKPEVLSDADNTNYYRNKVSNIFSDYSEDSYDSYWDSYDDSLDVTNIVEEAETLLNRSKYSEAFSIASAVIMESIKAFEYNDDSSGILSATIDEGFELVEEILNKNIPKEIASTIYEWLSVEILNPDYSSYGVDDSLDSLFVSVVIKMENYTEAHQIIDNKIKNLEGFNNWNSKSNTEKYLMQKVDLLKIEGKEIEAQQLIDDSLQFESFRILKLEKAISAKNYVLAEELILEGINIAKNEKLAGSIHTWKDKLLEIYKLQEDAIKFTQLLRELFIENNSEINYLRTYKKNVDSSKWKAELNKIITDIKHKSGRFGNIDNYNLAEIYVDENMIEELFTLVNVSNNINFITEYTKYLQDNYNIELIEKYKKYIETQADNTGREVYINLVKYLKLMAEIKDGIKPAIELKNSLLEKYRNRPAMKDEFKKLNWDYIR